MHTTISSFFQILEDCLVAERVDPLLARSGRTGGGLGGRRTRRARPGRGEVDRHSGQARRASPLPPHSIPTRVPGESVRKPLRGRRWRACVKADALILTFSRGHAGGGVGGGLMRTPCTQGAATGQVHLQRHGHGPETLREIVGVLKSRRAIALAGSSAAQPCHRVQPSDPVGALIAFCHKL